MLKGFCIPIKVVQLQNSPIIDFFTTSTCKKLTKLKLTTNPKLTCTQITKNLKKVS